MRGSPAVRGLAVVAAFLLLLVPILRMTSGGRPAGPAIPTMPSREESAVTLRLTSSATPFTFSVSHLGAAIWEGESSESQIEKEVAIPFPPEGIDLLVSADWEISAPSALAVELSRGDAAPSTQTVWGEESLTEVLTFR